MSCDDEILEALASLGNIDPETCTQMERFVCMLDRSKVCTKVNALNWFLYSNRAAEGESSSDYSFFNIFFRHIT